MGLIFRVDRVPCEPIRRLRLRVPYFETGELSLHLAADRGHSIVESHRPDLKADQAMSQLSEEFTNTENKLSFARQAHNDQVMQNNIYRQSFPQNFLSGLSGHAEDAGLLEFEDSAAIQAAPQVSF